MSAARLTLAVQALMGRRCVAEARGTAETTGEVWQKRGRRSRRRLQRAVAFAAEDEEDAFLTLRTTSRHRRYRQQRGTQESTAVLTAELSKTLGGRRTVKGLHNNSPHHGVDDNKAPKSNPPREGGFPVPSR